MADEQTALRNIIALVRNTLISRPIENGRIRSDARRISRTEQAQCFLEPYQAGIVEFPGLFAIRK